MVGRVSVVTAGLLVLAASAAGAGLATPVAGPALPEATGPVSDPTGAGAVVVQETDSTVTRITVAPDGTATWRVQVRTRLASGADVEEYEAFQTRFRENTSAFLDPFRERMRGVVAEAADATGRPMEARDFRAGTTIQTVPRRWGLVTYEFRWVGFAARDGDGLVVGDVFRGQFFLTANDTLAITGPDEYAVGATDPPPAERDPGTVRWFGPRSFPEDTPAVRFEPVTPTGTPGTRTTTAPGAVGATGTDRLDGTDESGGTDGETTSPDGTPVPSESGGPSLPLAVAVVVVGLLAVGAYRVYGGQDDPTDEDPATSSGSDPSTGETTGSADPDPVVTDADRVERLLREGGGQLRQSGIVEAMDWSKSKTSRVLSDMADEGRIEKLRIGRENVIRFPEDDELGGGESPAGRDSPDGDDEPE
jgi:hypothetical protein